MKFFRIYKYLNYIKNLIFIINIIINIIIEFFLIWIQMHYQDN
jgi:hypothetical protein